MAKRLFLLLFSASMGIINAPEILMASDDFDLNGLSNIGIVETVPIVEEPVVDTSVEKESVAESSVANADEPTTAEVYYAQEIVSQKANYTVSFYINSKREYMNTANNLSYDGLYKFKKMIYGHNSWNLLGSLVNRYVGEVFTVTEGGTTRDYQVMAVRIYRKTADGNLENDPGLMNNIATTALGYDLALFTCYGTSYGNGDASHRIAVFANAV